MAGLTLKDFDQSSPLTLDDLGSQKDVSGLTLNDKTTSQIAAVDTVMTAGTQDDYQQTKKQITDPVSREQFVIKHQQIRDAIWNHAQGSLPNLLADPTVDDQTKMQGVINSKITVDKLPPYSALATFAEEAAIADSGDNESERSANARYNALDTVIPVVKHKREMTARINALEIGKDADLVSKITDVAELMLPLAEWIHFTQLAGDAVPEGEGSNIPLLGEQKKAIIDYYQSLPIADQSRLFDVVLSIIQDNENIVLPDGNDLSKADTLHKLFVTNDYSDAERYFDDLTSVLDIIGVGGIVRSLAKSGKTAKVIKGAGKAGPKGAPKGGLDGDVLPPEGPSPSSAKGSTPDEPYDLSTSDYKDVISSTLTVQERRAITYNTHTEVVPTSPSQIVKDVNPEIARKMNQIVESDDTGEAATALYGTSKTEAIAHDYLPVPEGPHGPKGPDGTIPNKVEMRPSEPEPSDIRNTRLKDGNTILNDQEFARLGQKVDADLRNPEGMVLHPSSMVSRINKDGTIGFTARYSFIDGGFSSVKEAFQNAELAFSKYGLTAENKNFTLLSRQGDQWVPITEGDLVAKEALIKANPKVAGKVPALRADSEFAIGIDYNYRFSAEDIPELDVLTTAPGYVARIVQLADRLPSQWWASQGQGSIVQNLLDAASVIHPQILNAASVAVDKTYGLKKLYVDQFRKFGKMYESFDKARRAVMTDYIHQANLEGIKLDITDLINRGFNEEEIAALQQWRKANDIMWYATNDDMAKTLRGRGYETFVHHGSDTKLVGRPVARQSVDIKETIYDPVTNTNIKIGGTGNAAVSLQHLNNIYEKGGKLVRLAHPIKVDGKFVDLVLSRNSVEGGFTRRIYDGETVLAYRDGYYPVAYDANYFIDEVIKGADGKEFTVARAAAKDTKEAEQALRLLRANSPHKKFNLPRADRSLRAPGSHLFDEGHWSLSSSSGLTTQRFRGERLADAGQQMKQIGTAHLKDPLEAVAKQIHQVAQRAAMRTYMDTAKNRWMQNYGQYLELPRNKLTGQLEMPALPSQIRGKAGAPDKMVADARSNFNYLYGLENGYVNGIDAGYKAILHLFANEAAKMGWSLTERALLKSSTANPTQTLKTQAFKLLLGASPGRQALIQRGQLLLLEPVNPLYVSKHMVRDLVNIRSAIIAKALGKEDRIPKKVRELLAEVEDSGILEAVDAHNLIRDDLLHLADISNWSKFKKVAGYPLRVSQKYGFDMAEQDNLLGAWLTFRDKAIKEGVDLSTQRAKDKLHGDVRAFTLAMNRAGEQPYSQNTFGMVMQFQAFMHKALLQTISNRSLSAHERNKLLAYSAVVFGTGATMYGGLIEKLLGGTPPSETKDAIKEGLLDYLLNATLSAMSGEDINIDFSDFAPVEAYGMYDLFSGMLSSDIGEIISNNPAGSLYFGQNARITNIAKTMVRAFTPFDFDSPELKTKPTDVIVAALSAFSGMSSAFKGNYAFHTGKALSSYGRITDSDVSKVEALMMTLGFRTKTQSGFQDVKKAIYGDRSWETDDVKAWYLIRKRQLAQRGRTVAEIELSQAIMAEAWRVFGSDRRAAYQTILDEMRKDLANGDTTMLNGILRESGFRMPSDTWQLINKLPDSKLRDNLTAIMKTRDEARNDN